MVQHAAFADRIKGVVGKRETISVAPGDQASGKAFPVRLLDQFRHRLEAIRTHAAGAQIKHTTTRAGADVQKRAQAERLAQSDDAPAASPDAVTSGFIETSGTGGRPIFVSART